MRSLWIVLVCLLLLGTLSSASDAAEHTKQSLRTVVKSPNLDRALDDGDDDDGWPVGTKVYYEFEDGWYEGEITESDDIYVITWEDGSVDSDEYEDEVVDQMVQNYIDMVANDGGDDMEDGSPTPAPTENDEYEIGTPVYAQFDGVWYKGNITDYDEWGYTITWEDNSVDYDDFSDEDVDQFVENYIRYVENGEPLPTSPAAGDAAPAPTEAPTAAPTEDDGWPVGTKVYYEFEDGWYQGTITESDDIYVITWEDGSVDSDEYEDEVVDQMVQDYIDMVENGDGGDDDDYDDDDYDDDDEDDDTWPRGTKVYGQFEDGWYKGTITDYDEDGYTIEWDDGSIDYDDFSDEEVDQMVENYETMIANAPSDGGGTTAAASSDGGGLATGAIFVIVAVVIFALVGVWYFIRRRSNSKEEMEAISPTFSSTVNTPEIS